MTLRDPINEKLMREAIALAASARGLVEPNPMVGCIIHRDGRVIGRGWHRAFGQRHAEPDALASCTETPAGATAIVTLEPCCHTNKKTPPCVPALISAGLSRVVIGHTDPNPLVSGRGVAQLRAAGIDVVAGVLENECRQLNAPFFALMSHGRPYVTLKWAQTRDGFVGGAGRTPRSISSSAANELVHKLRTRCDAIMVSADSVLTDDPMLSVRTVPVLRTPIRCILDTHLRTPLAAKLVSTARDIPTHIFHAPGVDGAKADDLRRTGALLHEVPLAGEHLSFDAVLTTLGKMQATHLLVEPGERLAASLLSAGQFDRLWVIRCGKDLSEPVSDQPRAPLVSLPVSGTRSLGDQTLTEYLNPESDALFTPRPSPDLAL